MPLVRTDAIILQTYAYSETSKILRLLTRTHGLRSAIARGALRPRSRFGGVLEPFSTGVATFYLKEGRDLQTLDAFELERSGQALGRDLLRFGAASLLAELVLRTASEEPDPALYRQLLTGLSRLESADPIALEATILAEAWSMVGRLGYAPALESCLECDRELVPGEDARFDYAAGGVRCLDCPPGAVSRSLPAHARAALVRLSRGEVPPLERTAAHWSLFSRFLAHHVISGGPLRSLTFLMDTFARPHA